MSESRAEERGEQHRTEASGKVAACYSISIATAAIGIIVSMVHCCPQLVWYAVQLLRVISQSVSEFSIVMLPAPLHTQQQIQEMKVNRSHGTA